jgi:hypothetical protein
VIGTFSVMLSLAQLASVNNAMSFGASSAGRRRAWRSRHRLGDSPSHWWKARKNELASSYPSRYAVSDKSSAHDVASNMVLGKDTMAHDRRRARAELPGI